MSVLLLGLESKFGSTVIQKLLDEGDTVGVIEEDRARGEEWKKLGAHVALGSPADFDLIERAAQHARSIVIVESGLTEAGDVVDATLMGARLVPGERARVIFVAVAPGPEIGETLTGSEFDFVILKIGTGKSLIRRSRPMPPEQVAEAINAADDLAGSPRVEVDLGSKEGWSSLGLAPPADLS